MFLCKPPEGPQFEEGCHFPNYLLLRSMWRVSCNLFFILFVAVNIVACVDEEDQASDPTVLSVVAADALEVRRQIVARDLLAAFPTRFEQAEQAFSAAGVAAKSGDLDTARDLAIQAARAYRTATLGIFKVEMLPAARKRLARARPDLPPSVVENASTELTKLAQFLEDVSSRDFEIHEISDSVLGRLVNVDISLENQELAPIKSCPDPVQPEFNDLTVEAPEPGALISRQAIHYLAGQELEVSFRIPSCTTLSQVLLISPLFGGSLELGTNSGGYDPVEDISGAPYYYELVSNIPGGSNDRIVIIRLDFPRFLDGRSINVQLVADSVSGDLRSSVEFTVSLVANLGNQAIMGISETGLRNGFIAGIYDDYGDDGRREPAQDDADDRTLYNPAYRDLELRVADDGIHFAWNVDVVVDHLCDPTALIEGIFHLERDGQQITVHWDLGPDIKFKTFPCIIPSDILILIRGLILIYFEDKAEGIVRNIVQNRINTLLANMQVDPAFIANFQTRAGQIEIHLVLPFNMVTVEVPYGTRRLEEALYFGLALNSGEEVGIIASGRPRVCFGGESPPVDCAREPDAAGLFNWNANVPVPSPWQVTEFGTIAYFKERHKAWKELRGLRRKTANLPFPDRNVAALVGRLGAKGLPSSTFTKSAFTTHFIGEPCTITAQEVAQDRLAFGANDHRFLNVQELGTGTRQITVFWPPSDTLDPCPRSEAPIDTLISGSSLLQQ